MTSLIQELIDEANKPPLELVDVLTLEQEKHFEIIYREDDEMNDDQSSVDEDQEAYNNNNY